MVDCKECGWYGEFSCRRWYADDDICDGVVFWISPEEAKEEQEEKRIEEKVW